MNKSNKKLLIIEDEIDLREIIKANLDDSFHSIDHANDGHEAFEMIKKNYYDVIVTDVRMPGMNGMEILKSIQERQLHTPVIVISGHASKEEFRKAWGFGAFDFFEKPIDFLKLQDAIRSALLSPRKKGNDPDNSIQNKEFSEYRVLLDKKTEEAINLICIKSQLSLSTLISEWAEEKKAA